MRLGVRLHRPTPFGCGFGVFVFVLGLYHVYSGDNPAGPKLTKLCDFDVVIQNLLHTFLNTTLYMQMRQVKGAREEKKPIWKR